MFDIITYIVSGAVLGFLIGLTGVGGGVLAVPVMILIMKLPTTTAIGTACGERRHDRELGRHLVDRHRYRGERDADQRERQPARTDRDSAEDRQRLIKQIALTDNAHLFERIGSGLRSGPAIGGTQRGRQNGDKRKQVHPAVGTR